MQKLRCRRYSALPQILVVNLKLNNGTEALDHLVSKRRSLCDLFAIWYSTKSETGTELTVIASRLKAGQDQWEPSSEFFKAPNRNMHGSSIFAELRRVLAALIGKRK